MMADVSAIIVLYNSALDDAPAVLAALTSPWVCDVVVCDNGTTPADNGNRAAELGVKYLPMGGNKGLSAAYRRGIAEAEGGIICIFDDDTIVGLDYFKAVTDAFAMDGDFDIALPAVVADSFVLSPCRFNGLWAKPFASLEEIRDCEGMSGINSGMAIRRSVFSALQHDERLFLDYVDHRFIADARKAGMGVSYLKGPVLRQNFSLETDSKSQAAVRWRIYKEDSKVFFSGSMRRRTFGLALRALRSAKLCLKHKTFMFFGKAD